MGALNFDAQRKATLEQIKKLKQKRTKDRIEAAKNSLTNHKQFDTSILERHNVVMYGAASSYMETAKEYISRTHNVMLYTEVEDAIDYCLNNKVTNVILDMDEPTDWRMSTDVFSTVKTIHPDAWFLLCTRDKKQVPVLTLESKGAVVIGKPLITTELQTFLENCK